jgi:dolichol-phosphate mannosyltransferase
VKRGFERATGEFVAVMDADLQHPPALLPVLLETARRETADVVVASRFAAGGGTGEFGLVRRFVSRASAAAARLFFPRRLAAVSDPMSGFFLVRRDRLRPEELHPRGFKILLEVLVRCRPLRIAEAPYTFGERVAGTSKASLREGLNYLAHLVSLRFGQRTLRLARFALVGGSGVVVNMGLLALLTERFGLFYLASAIVAAETSICSNYLLSELWVFRARGSSVGLLGRFAGFFALNNAALGVSIPLLGLLVSGLHLQYLVANLIAIAALTLARFAVADALIWHERRPRRHPARWRPVVLRTAPVRVRRS